MRKRHPLALLRLVTCLPRCIRQRETRLATARLERIGRHLPAVVIAPTRSTYRDAETFGGQGYDWLTLDAVAATARASKATVARRWPTKAELVLAAFVEGVRSAAAPPDTGTLRGELLQVGETIAAHARRHAGVIRAVLVEATRNAALKDAMQHQLSVSAKALMDKIGIFPACQFRFGQLLMEIVGHQEFWHLAELAWHGLYGYQATARP